MDEQLKDACYTLRSAVDDLLPIVTMNGFAIEMLDPDGLITFANEVMGGIRKLASENNLVADNGEELREVIERYGVEKIRRQFEAMRENAPRTGNKAGAVVRDYIIERIHHYRQLGCLTRGEIYERICEELAKSDEVQRWQKAKGDWEKYETGTAKEVQAFIRLSKGSLSRTEGSEKLDEIEGNARRAKK